MPEGMEAFMTEAADHFEMEDLVRITGQDDTLAVKGYHQGTNKYQVQRGRDAATVVWVAAGELELVQRAKRDDGDARFIPARGIME